MYSELIVSHFTEPAYVGDLPAHGLEYEIGNSVCGDRIRIQADLDNGVVKAIAFRAWGCATSVATADIFCEAAKDRMIDEIAAREEDAMAEMLGELDPSQHHCIKILVELHKGLVANATVGES